LQTEEQGKSSEDASVSQENASVAIHTQKVENTESHEALPIASENEASEDAENIPIHTIYDYELPPEGLLPEKRSSLDLDKEGKPSTPGYTEEKSSRSRVTTPAFLILLVLALSTLLYAVGNSGYLDRYTSSYKQVAKLFNIIVYIK
jgi:hypothetical protein